MGRSVKLFLLISLFLLTLGTIVWRIYLVPHYPLHEDELISLQVLSSIAEKGLPLTEGGFIYWRSVLAYYLMSVPVIFLGLSEYSVRLVPILCSGLLLPVIYLLAKRCGSATAGGIAVLFLSLSSFENVMANFSRFYAPFQLFFCLAVLMIPVSFSSRRVRDSIILFVATLFAIGSHRLAAELFFFYAFGLLLQRRLDLLRSIKAWLFIGSIALFACFAWFWSPENVHSGAVTLPVTMGALVNKWFFYELVNRFVPFGWLLIVLGGYPALKTRGGVWLYLLCGFVVSFLFFSLVAPSDSERYVAHLFPLAVLLAALSLSWWSNQIYSSVKSRSVDKRAGICLVVTLLILIPFNFRDFHKRDLPESIGTSITYRDQKPAHDFIKKNLGENDIIISTEPGLTNYYLKTEKVYFLREYLDLEKRLYQEFPEEIRPCNYETFIDSPEKLKKVLREKGGKVWLYANWKIEKTISLEMDALVKKRFRGVFSQGHTYVLVTP